MPTSSGEVRDRVLDAAMIHVPFEGWSESTLRAAIRDSGVDQGEARATFPRGALDLALAFHERGDAKMVERLRSEDLSHLRFRDRIAMAVRYRIDAIGDREAARRASSFFALPQNAQAGARAVWTTVDKIWTTLGDSSEDYNWYTKRATLSAVYGSTLLYWLGDDSLNHQETWSFLDRRVDNVMSIERAKQSVHDNPVLRRAFAAPNWVLNRVRSPRSTARTDVPGAVEHPLEPRE